VNNVSRISSLQRVYVRTYNVVDEIFYGGYTEDNAQGYGRRHWVQRSDLRNELQQHTTQIISGS